MAEQADAGDLKSLASRVRVRFPSSTPSHFYLVCFKEVFISNKIRSAGSIKEFLRAATRISQGNGDIIKSAVKQALLCAKKLEQTILLYREV